MAELFSLVMDWVSDNAAWIVPVSILYFVVSLLIIRVLIVRIPADYFLERVAGPGAEGRTFGGWVIRIAKNLLGIVVVLVGLVMSLPGVAGQGILTVLLGLTLTDFPGKRRLELRLVGQPLILRTINDLRRKSGKQPLLLPDGETGSAGGSGAAAGG